MAGPETVPTGGETQAGEEQLRQEKVDKVVEYLEAFDELEEDFKEGGHTEEELGALEEGRDAIGAELDAIDGVDRRSASLKLKQLEAYFAAEQALDNAYKSGSPEDQLDTLDGIRSEARSDFGDGLDSLIAAKARANSLIQAEEALNAANNSGASEEELGALETARDAARKDYVDLGGDPNHPWGTEGSKDEYRFLAEVYVGQQEAKAEFIDEHPEVTEQVGRATVELGNVLDDDAGVGAEVGADGQAGAEAGAGAEANPEGQAGVGAEDDPDALEPEDPASKWAEDVESVEYDGSRTPDEWREAYPQREDETDEEYYDRLNDMLLTEYVMADDGEKARRELNPTAREKYEEMVQKRLENGDLTQEEADRMLGLTQEHEDNENARKAFEEAQDVELQSIVRRVNANDPDALEFLEKHPELKDDVLRRVAELNDRDPKEVMGDGDGSANPEGNPDDKNPDGDPSGENPDGDPDKKPGGKVIDNDPNPDIEPAGKEKDPLIAVNLNKEQEARNAAHKIAERWFEEKRGARKGLFKKIVLGVTDNLFREAKIKRYEKQAYEAIREKQDGVTGENTGRVLDQDWAANKAGIARFVEAYVSGFQDEFISRGAGENMDVYGVEKGEDGKEVVYKYSKDEQGHDVKEAMDAESPESKATVEMHKAISEYAQGKMDRASFREAMARVQAELHDGGSQADLMIDNYTELAEVAKDRFDHEGRIENVMEGFRLINGESRSNIRSEAHRDAVDRLTNKISNIPGLRWIPPEVIGGAVGIATYVTQNTARTALKALIPGVGGAVGAGTLAAFKERNRVTGDRATLAARIATGESAGDTKYDQAMLETMYEMKPATEYTEGLTAKIEAFRNEQNAENTKSLLGALATVEMAIRMSDQTGGKGIDLISYSSGDTEQIEQERLALMVARAQAKTLLGRDRLEASKAYANALESARETFQEDIDAKDKAFKSLRRRREAAQFGKTAATSMVTMVAGQEIVAAFSPDKYGVVDYLRGQADPGTSKTLMANLFKLKPNVTPGFEQVAGTPVTTTIAEGAKMTDEQVAQYRAQGYTVTPRTIPGETVTNTENISVEDYALKYGTKIHHYKEAGAGWANNGTVAIDGNELNVQFGNGGTGDTFVTSMYSPSTLQDGRAIDVVQAMQDGKVSMYLYLSNDTQGMPIKLDATLLDNGQMEFSAPNETIRQIIENRSYRFAEVVYDQGLNEDGIRENITALATAVGPGLDASKTLEDVVTTVGGPQTVYDVIQTVTPTIDVEKPVEDVADIMATAGIAFSRRKELTLGDRPAPKQGNTGGIQNPPTPPTGGGKNDRKVVSNPPTPPTGGSAAGSHIPPTPPAGSVVRAGEPQVDRRPADNPDQQPQPGQGQAGEQQPQQGQAGEQQPAPTGEPQVDRRPAGEPQVDRRPADQTSQQRQTGGQQQSQTGGQQQSQTGGQQQSQTGGQRPQPTGEPQVDRRPADNPEQQPQPGQAGEQQPQPTGEQQPAPTGEQAGEEAKEKIEGLQDDIKELLDWPWEEEYEDDPGNIFRAAGNQMWWSMQAESKLNELRRNNQISKEQYDQMFNDIARSRQVARQRVVEDYARQYNVTVQELTTPTEYAIGTGVKLEKPMSPADQLIKQKYDYLTRVYAARSGASR